MPRCLMVVEDVFEISGRGIVLSPAFDPLNLGFGIELRRPDGTKIGTTIGGVGSFLNSAGEPRFAVLLKDLTRGDVPLGTEVWSTAEREA